MPLSPKYSIISYSRCLDCCGLYNNKQVIFHPSRNHPEYCTELPPAAQHITPHSVLRPRLLPAVPPAVPCSVPRPVSLPVWSCPCWVLLPGPLRLLLRDIYVSSGPGTAVESSGKPDRSSFLIPFLK